MKKAALYNPYLDVLGGGEKHILSILKIFDEEEFAVDIFWDRDLKKEIKKRFDLEFNTLNFTANIFKDKNKLNKWKILKNYDYFFYVTDGSYFFSRAKKNYVFSMVPKKELYSLNLANRIKLLNFNFITNSKFTQGFLDQWGIKSEVIYPFITEKLLENSGVGKEKIILSVGRFFPRLHSKKQTKIVQSFNRLIKYKEFSDFKLVLAGGLKKEDSEYLEELKRVVADNKSIELKINIDYEELVKLYKKSTFYWHFTGYGIDENIQPEAVEHLGIAPLEAMAAKAIVFCFNAGGPKEFIVNGKNGFLFNNEEDLITKMLKIFNNQLLQKEIINNTNKTIVDSFSKNVFKKKVKDFFQI